jgi:DNA replication and repair protein RecF
MQLEQLVIKDVRNLTEIQLDCGHNTNIITGRNAAGKTAILESIYLLARAASFRTPKLNEVIQHGKQGLAVSARLNSKNTEYLTGTEKNLTATQIKFNGAKVNKRSEQAQNIPVIAYTAETNRLLYDMPKARRHWLDWSMFHVEPGYMDTRQTYHHALRQRNALLREDNSNDTQYQPWERTMAETAHRLNEARNNYLVTLNEEITRLVSDREPGQVSIELSEKQADGECIRERLQQDRTSDRRIGHTQSGPHRQDIYFRLNGYTAGKTLSRGAGKQFLLCLLIAQARAYNQKRDHYPVMLIDDLPAEFDHEMCADVFNKLVQQPLQSFITTTTADPCTVYQGGSRRFHVEHGSLVKQIA